MRWLCLDDVDTSAIQMSLYDAQHWPKGAPMEVIDGLIAYLSKWTYLYGFIQFPSDRKPFLYRLAIDLIRVEILVTLCVCVI